MKKSIIILMTVTTILCSLLCAQQATAQASKPTFGFQGGPNLSKFVGKTVSGDKLTHDFTIGSHAGFNVEIPMGKDFYFQPGLAVSNEGTKNKQNSTTASLALHNVELPLNFLFKPGTGGNHLILGIGTAVSYGLNGKWELTSPGYAETGKVIFSNEADHTTSNNNEFLYLKPLDVSINFQLGCQIQKFVIQLEAEQGLLNRVSDYYASSGNGKPIAKNMGFGLSVGYRFK